jgi:hypothetical protein
MQKPSRNNALINVYCFKTYIRKKTKPVTNAKLNCINYFQIQKEVGACFYANITQVWKYITRTEANRIFTWRSFFFEIQMFVAAST